MMAVVFGDEKPNPNTHEDQEGEDLAIGVVSPSRKKPKSAAPDIPIPTEATCPGDIRSARRPETGATKAWTIGWTRSMVPAVTGSVAPYVLEVRERGGTRPRRWRCS